MAATTTSADNNDEPSLRLLIHAVDGAIPYLTPHLLEKCFPAEQVKDILWIGMSVRDACIVPVMKKPKDGVVAKKGTAPKPAGYTFWDKVVLDRWLANYTRVTVPTFDPIEDAVKFSPKKVADTSTLTASNKHVMVWTENGRQPLSMDVYRAAARGLDSRATVSLFDVSLPEATQRRRRAARQRTNEWRQDMIQTTPQQASDDHHNKSPLIWTSHLIVPQEKMSMEDREVEQQLEAIQKAVANNQVSGVAFVGWQYAITHEQQKSLLQNAVESLNLPKESSPSITLAVLATHSLTQFLDCYQAGINVVGTNLPAKWAKEKLAFCCDLQSWNKQRPEAKRPRLMEGESGIRNNERLDENGCVQVMAGSDADSWIRDDRPILSGCSCMTCQKHSRAYLYHLVKTKELLVEILLFIHNLHHMIGLCRELSAARTDDQQEDLYQHILSQL